MAVWNIRRISLDGYQVGVTQAGGPLVHRFEAGHRLIAGVTRSGKTFTCNAMLCAFATRADCAIVGLDPKMTGFQPWHPRFTEVACTLSEIDAVISRCLQVLEARKQYLALQGRDKWLPSDGPRLVVAVDEFADLAGLNTAAIDRTLTGRELESQFKGQQALSKIRTADVATLARMGAGLGIDLVVCTQYPEVQVLPSQIRSQLDIRIIHRVTSKEQLAVCLGQGRADALDLRDVRPGVPGMLWIVGTVDHEHTELARSAFVEMADVAAHAERYAFLQWSWPELLALQSVGDKADTAAAAGRITSAQHALMIRYVNTPPATAA